MTQESKESIITESTAKAELYTLKMNLFKPPKLAHDFVEAILAAKTTKSLWDEIFAQYGTHYVTQTVVGGRASLQYKMTYKDFQELTAIGVDIKAAATYKMVSISGGVSVNTNSLESFKDRTTEFASIFVGGSPNDKNDLVKWSDGVVENPSPISYHMKDFTHLITKSHFPTLTDAELTGLKHDYLNATYAYCTVHKCAEPVPDLPYPKPITTTSHNTELIGGPKGAFFEESFPKNKLLRASKVTIHYACGWLQYQMRGIQFSLSDGVHTHLNSFHGGRGGCEGTFTVPQGQFIKTIEIYKGSFTFDADGITGIKFTTNKNFQSEWYGPKDGKYHIIHLKGDYLVGVNGRATSDYIYSLQFVSNTVNY